MDRSGDGTDSLSAETKPEFDAEPIKPGTPSAENVAFVLLGVLGALYVVAQIAGLV